MPLEPMPEQPVKWLLREIKSYLTEEQYVELMTGFNRVKMRYDLVSRLRAEQYRLTDFKKAQKTYPEDSERWRHWAIRIESKAKRIERLQQQLQELA